MAQIVSGTTKSLFHMSSFWSSVFSICDKSKVDFNCLGTTLYSFESLQEPYFKTHNLQIQRWEDALNISEPGVNRATWKSYPTTAWFCQCLRINFNKIVCFPSKFIRQINNPRAFIKEIIIRCSSLDGDSSHTTNVVNFPFSMPTIDQTLRTGFSFSFASIWTWWKCLADLCWLLQLSLWSKIAVAWLISMSDTVSPRTCFTNTWSCFMIIRTVGIINFIAIGL